MNRNVPVAFQKQALGPLALAIPALKFIGGAAATAAAGEGINRLANKALGPQGGTGPRGPHSYGPPNFGHTHSRDRADPDFGNEGSDPRHPVAGFKMATAVLASMGLLKHAVDPVTIGPGDPMTGAAAPAAAAASPGFFRGLKEQVEGYGRNLGGHISNYGHDLIPERVYLAGGDATYNWLKKVHGNVNAQHSKRFGPEVGLAAANAVLENPRTQETARKRGLTGRSKAIDELPLLEKMKARAGQGLAATGRWMIRNPKAGLGAAVGAGALGLGALGYGYRGAKAMFGSSDDKKSEKQSAAIVSDNLLDVLAFNVAMAEKNAGFR